MLEPKIRRPSAATLISLVALVFAMSGLAVAASGGGGATIRGCYQKKGGSLRIASRCSTREKALSWNQQGGQGPQGGEGPQGAQGVQGSPGTNGTNGANGTNGTNGSPALSALVGRINGLSVGTEFGAPSGISTANATEAKVSDVAPNASSTARDLFVKLTAAPGGGVPGAVRTFTLMVNGSATTLACLIAGSATSCTDSFHTAAVPAGATVSIQAVGFVGDGSTLPPTPPQAADARFGFRATTP
jgi:hypothetical protein